MTRIKHDPFYDEGYTRKQRKAGEMIDRFFVRVGYNLRNARLHRRYKAHNRQLNKAFGLIDLA